MPPVSCQERRKRQAGRAMKEGQARDQQQPVARQRRAAARQASALLRREYSTPFITVMTA
jgi:hypothetical protein